MNNANDNGGIQHIKQELLKGWFYIFVMQLVIGGYAIYELADKYPDIGFIPYTLILTIGAAIIAAVLLLILAILFTIIGAIFVGCSLWRERKNDAS